MKKIIVVLSFLACWSFSLSAQALSEPVAIIRMGSTKVITQAMFHEREALVTGSSGQVLSPTDQKSLLNLMIQEELFRQAASEAGIRATEDDVMRQFRQSNPNMTDEQIHQQAESEYKLPWNKILKELEAQLTIQKYLISQPDAREMGKGLDVSDAEVTNFFNDHQAQFVLPDMVRVSYIFFDTKVHPKGTFDEIHQRAEKVLSEIKNGKLTFEEAVRLYSEDPRTAQMNGDMGFVPRDLDSPNFRPIVALFGKSFLQDLFKIKIGDVKLLESKAGFHIVKVTDSISRHFLGLDDPVFPGQSLTVREYIKQNLYKEKAMQAQQQFINKVADQLKKKADIQTFPQNF
jgi:parvulin-like peptidyl-prolyl isomerase